MPTRRTWAIARFALFTAAISSEPCRRPATFAMSANPSNVQATEISKARRSPPPRITSRPLSKAYFRTGLPISGRSRRFASFAASARGHSTGSRRCCRVWYATTYHRTISGRSGSRCKARSHRSPKHPGRKLGAAEIETLALGRLAGCRFQHQLENALAALLHGFLAFEDGAAIDVHVVFHALVHRRVGGELDRGGGLAAEHAAASRGEADHVGAAGHLPRGRDRVVAGRVHEDKTLLGDGLGVVEHVDQIGAAGLGNRAH